MYRFKNSKESHTLLGAWRILPVPNPPPYRLTPRMVVLTPQMGVTFMLPRQQHWMGVYEQQQKLLVLSSDEALHDFANIALPFH